jgi:hypothetical protein
MSEKMKQLVEDKDPQRLRNVVDGWTQDWHGCVSYPALAQFMATGVMSRHQPGGFTLFMFKPMGLRRRTKDETKEMLRSAMGEYKVNDKILRDLAKTDWHLPMDIDSALRQIQTGWRFLELLFCEDTIAAEGYRCGETVLKTHRYRIAKALETDKLFLVRYLHLLDSIFQVFLGELVGYFGQQEHPLPAARRRLTHYMANRVDECMRQVDIGQLPNLALPKGISEATERDSKPAPTSKGGNPPGFTGASSQTPVENPEKPLDFWKGPEGKSFQALWLKGGEKSRKGLGLLPRVTHHLSGKHASLCVKFQREGRCRSGCPFAHLPSSQLSPKESEDCRKACKAVYK